jgi:hypothetical protein
MSMSINSMMLLKSDGRCSRALRLSFADLMVSPSSSRPNLFSGD